VQKFLGLANYYRRFIKNFARIAALLHMLVRKEQKWKWEKEQEEAFGKLKMVFTTEPVLAIPDIDRNRDRCLGLCNRRSVVDKI